jgi:hypothetical protein
MASKSGGANSKWRSYVSRHQRRSTTPSRRSSSSAVEATARIGGDTNRGAFSNVPGHNTVSRAGFPS